MMMPLQGKDDLLCIGLRGLGFRGVYGFRAWGLYERMV